LGGFKEVKLGLGKVPLWDLTLNLFPWGYFPFNPIFYTGISHKNLFKAKFNFNSLNSFLGIFWVKLPNFSLKTFGLVLPSPIYYSY